MSDTPYDPLECLEREVERFKRTNTFTPMEVTGFYIQAACVIHELKQLRTENESLRKIRDRQAAMIRAKESELIALEDALADAAKGAKP